MNGLGARLRALRADRGLLQKHLAEKAGLTASMVSQMESGRLMPTLGTLGKLAGALGISIPELLEPAAGGRSLYISRKHEHPVVTFDKSAERWMVLGAGLFEGKVRAVVATLDGKGPSLSTDKVIIKRGQLKLLYVLQGKVKLHYTGETHLMREGDSALLDGGSPHKWDNASPRRARVLWVILG